MKSPSEMVQDDVVTLARQCGYPMDNQLHVFIVKLCELYEWDATATFQAIFNERPLPYCALCDSRHSVPCMK